ncbi:hypothetical protein [Maridesulfovibrio salexigens]|uniref:DUF4153 domain-containing protein n=1 Tax=Maridesulfovibrio salexigens (strain ATCC 14822 / DSM 2638 / NCIMB 8403 / VKM B-1763) TaxID=526222 RepID=C6BSZ8_MARSD|nr:hypothetical protein [Maridesulfovibrio salexigens]ACS79702.1 hypothetical protein Desal_1640 [Maridesulfovibrio salexigens DSM 2638]
MGINSKINNAINKPEELEKIYRSNPRNFKKNYQKAFSNQKDSILFRAWQARLEYAAPNSATLSAIDLAAMLLLCFLAGTILKLPDWANLDNYEILGWMSSLIPLTAMFIYSMHMRGWPRKSTIVGLGISAVIGLVMHFLPVKWNDTFELACLNLPFLLWSFYGFSRISQNWRSTEQRIEFLRFSGEWIIHAGLFFLGGGILLLLTFGLLDILHINSSWIIEDMAIYGLASIPLVAAWATDTYSAARKLVPLLARIFSPLLLVLILGYMGAMAWNTNELFQDRSTLLTYNILLLTVLATAIFTLTGRGEKESGKLATWVISLMVVATVILDLVGICAIGWRIIEFGLTANRLSVLGSNLVVFGNLAVMGSGYLRYHSGKGTLDDVESGLARYLPCYSIWTGFSVLILPWIFRY